MPRLAALALTALALTVGAYVLGSHAASAAPAPAPVPTTTVHTTLSMGACAVDAMNHTTGVMYEHPVYICAPAFSPDGYPVLQVDSSDGWAHYPGSAWEYDGERLRFVPTVPEAQLDI